MSKMFERPASLSFLIFTAEVQHAIPQLLADTGYKLLKTTSVRKTASKLYLACNPIGGPRNNIVSKAAFQAARHTFLLEPEMVLIT